jgi:hypothetical protein
MATTRDVIAIWIKDHKRMASVARRSCGKRAGAGLYFLACRAVFAAEADHHDRVVRELEQILAAAGDPKPGGGES